MKFFILSLLVVVFIIVVNCGPGGPCKHNDDCGGPDICYGGQCMDQPSTTNVNVGTSVGGGITISTKNK